MADDQYQPGSMDISAQEKTFEGFVRWSKIGVIVILVILVFLTVFAI